MERAEAWAKVGAVGAAVALAPWGLRKLVDLAVDRVIRRLLTEPYFANLWELAAGLGHSPLRATVENALRAQEGRALHRPIGPPRRPPDLSGLRFRPVQLVRRPLEPHEPVDTTLTIGPKAARPVRLDIPILLGAMAYGLGISKGVAVALARGSAMAGSACNTGNGPLLPEVRRAARTVVVQVTGTPWTGESEALAQADMVEIRVGRGAWAGAGQVVEAKEIPRGVARRIGLRPGQPATVPTSALAGRGQGRQGRERLDRLVAALKDRTGGVPIGVKLAAGHDLEAELDVALEAGADFVAVDAAGGGTHESPCILQDDFGLPLLHAVGRARRHLDRQGVGRDVTLLVGGGLLTPGDCLKCMALGADGVYLATAALLAMTHTQAAQALPWEPPTQLLWASGSRARRFDPGRGARSLARFLLALTDEMAIGARALGKGALREVSRDDLVALDPATAAIAGVPLAYEPPPFFRMR